MRVVTGAIEVERRDKRMGAALEAGPRVYIADADLAAALGNGLDPAEVFRTSAATLVAGEGPAARFQDRRGSRASSVEVLPADGRS